MMGLSPGPPISVAPSGMVPPFKVNPGPRPGVDSGEAMPADAGGPEAEPHGPAVSMPVAGPIDPPPSNVEPVPAVGDESVPVAAHGSGLRPPGSISVAPRGIPLCSVGNAEPRLPSGDVAPIGGALVVPWA